MTVETIPLFKPFITNEDSKSSVVKMLFACVQNIYYYMIYFKSSEVIRIGKTRFPDQTKVIDSSDDKRLIVSIILNANFDAEEKRLLSVMGKDDRYMRKSAEDFYTR